MAINASPSVCAPPVSPRDFTSIVDIRERRGARRDGARLLIILACVFGGLFGLASQGFGDTDPLEASRAAAEKARQEQQAAEKTLADAKARVEKATAETANAQRDLTEKAEAARKAEEVLRAQETYAADKAAVEAKAALSKAEKGVRDAEAAARRVAGEQETARVARDRAAAEKAAAQKDAEQATPADKETRDKSLADKEVALQKAEESFLAAQAAAQKAEEARNASNGELAAARTADTQAAERAARAKAVVLGGLTPLAASSWDRNKARHLLFRAGLGGPPQEVARLHEMGLFAAVDYLVDYHLQPEPAGWFDAFPHLRTAPYERHLNEAQRAELNQARVSFRWDQHHRLRKAWIERLVRTERPLQEKLTLFWHGHFACSYLPAEDSFSMWQQNENFRRRAAGNFGALLRGIVHDPAMIRYLDNHLNFKGSGNENLGREILELFSMGEGQGYTEQDLAEAARALTGYNFEYNDGQFKFIGSRHDNTEKTLFGKKGYFGGDELVDVILQQQATSRYIARKLFRFFAHENPDPETIEKMAGVLRASDYELRPMLRNLFQSEEFYSQRSMGTHVKSPIELVIGSIRTLELEQVDYGAIDSTVSDMGQRLFEPPNVAGWAGGRDWIDASSLFLRYNAVSSLVEKTDLVEWLQRNRVADPATAVDHLVEAFLCVPLNDAKRQELLKHVGTLPPLDQWSGQRDAINASLRAALVAVVSLPEYQLARTDPKSDPPLHQLDPRQLAVHFPR